MQTISVICSALEITNGDIDILLLYPWGLILRVWPYILTYLILLHIQYYINNSDMSHAQAVTHNTPTIAFLEKKSFAIHFDFFFVLGDTIIRTHWLSIVPIIWNLCLETNLYYCCALLKCFVCIFCVCLLYIYVVVKLIFKGISLSTCCRVWQKTDASKKINS